MTNIAMLSRLITVVVFLTSLYAQETRSTIAGRVLDPQAAAVAGAAVRVTHTDTGLTVTLATNETGYYEAALLIPGNYSVTAECAGFKTTVRSGISLPVSTRLEIDVKLELGQIAETVSVTAEAPLLDASTVSEGGLMDNKMVMDLPVLGNNPLLLAKMTPGMYTDGVNNYLGLHSVAGSSDLYVAGGVGGNEWAIDGVPNNGGSRRVAYLPYADTIQEFRVETSGFDVSQGRGTGASVLAISKSGANDYHGTMTEQHWQQRWNATPFFVKQLYYRRINEAEARGDHTGAEALRREPKQPSGHSNNYSATLGGPILKNRLFSFFSFNGFIDVKTEDASSINRTVPTMANRRGDFSQLLNVDANRYQLYDPFSVRQDPDRPTHWVRDPIPGNILPRSRMINPVYDAYVKLLPVPNNDPMDPRKEPRVNYMAVGTPYNWDYKAFHQRLDYNHSGRHRFFGRWSWNNFLEDRGDWTYESARGLHSNGLNRRNESATVDWTYTHSARTLFDFAIAANDYREGSVRRVAMSYKPSDVGLPKYMDDWAGDKHIIPNMDWSGYTGIGPSSVPTFANYRMMSFKADVSQVRSKHTIRAGFDTRQHFRTGGGGGNTSGNFDFGNNYTRKYDDSEVVAGDLGHSWAAFFMGLPNGMKVSTNNETYAMHSPYYGGYVQDNWRVRRRLTISVGLRLEYELGPTERYNRMIGYFDPSLSLPVSNLAAERYALNPILELPVERFTVRGGSTFPAVDGVSRRAFQPELMWMPRFAVAWQIDSRTVLRGGAGVFYDTLNVLNQAPKQTGFSRETSTSMTSNYGYSWTTGDPANGISPLVDPFPVRRDGTRFNTAPGSALGAMTEAGRSFSFRDWGTQHARQRRWRLGIQRQLRSNMSVSATYVGSYADRVYISRNLRPLPAEYWADGLVRQDATSRYLTGNVPNPFRLSNFPNFQTDYPLLYEELTSPSGPGAFRNSTVQRQQLLRPFPHMTGVTQDDAALGIVRTHSLEVTFQRRFSKGLSLNGGYTRLYNKTADWFPNEFDERPAFRPGNKGRPHRVVVTGIYQLPFGKRRAFMKSGVLSRVFGGFQSAVTYEWQPGPLLDFSNRFYYGDLENIGKVDHTLDRWFNTDDFETRANRGPASYHRRVFPSRIDGVRRDMTNQWNTNLQRDFRLPVERARLTVRFDVLNVQNRSQFNSPDTNPFSTNFGRVTSQSSAMNRFLQLQARVQW